MQFTTMSRTVGLVIILAGCAGWAFAQPAEPAEPTLTPEEEAVNALRSLANISPLDEERIAGWINQAIDKAVANQADRDARFRTLHTAFEQQRLNPGNSAAFVSALAAQTAQVTTARLQSAEFDPVVARALTRAMIDQNRTQTVPGFVAALRFPDAATRALAANGLSMHLRRVAEDRPRLEQVIGALRSAGEAERDPVALQWIYRALSYDDQFELVYPAFISILDNRLERRGSDLRFCDGAELSALRFFVRVAGKLNGDQQKELVGRLAALLRFDGERYLADRLTFTEQDRVERSLTLIEELFERFTRQPGSIRTQLETGVRAPLDAEPPDTATWQTNREAFQQAISAWIGSEEPAVEGVLNQAPWSVPASTP